MAWTTTPYCVLADVKAAMAVTTTADDAFITGLIPQAQATIDRYVGFPFQLDGTPANPATRVYSGNENDTLFIAYCQQIVTVTESIPVVTAGIGGNLQSGTPLTRDITADCILGPDNWQTAIDGRPAYLLNRYTGDPFAFGQQNYVIKGVWGWAVVPPDISRACIRIAGHYYKMRDTSYADELAEMNAVRLVYRKNLPADVIEILERYRRRLFLVW